MVVIATKDDKEKSLLVKVATLRIKRIGGSTVSTHQLKLLSSWESSPVQERFNAQMQRNLRFREFLQLLQLLLELYYIVVLLIKRTVSPVQ